MLNNNKFGYTKRNETYDTGHWRKAVLIQELLGHKSSKTTEIYTHVSKANLAKIENPLDRLMKEEGK